jgi:hypothetical protein
LSPALWSDCVAVGVWLGGAVILVALHLIDVAVWLLGIHR